eukprot:TRINITY_DN1347_c0_g1_i1.p1 TRINITY_DN1347_c0_g1~~TRINITY_DN1347_c0_g1_i1.p1  ORF type:complete len:233 (+),score=38.76 TRINITY_DN1347_c0_g1_i1:241-939(+)
MTKMFAATTVEAHATVSVPAIPQSAYYTEAMQQQVRGTGAPQPANVKMVTQCQGYHQKSFRMCGCKENGYDNVRVVRGQMTIRCRGCEHRVKAATTVVKGWRCQEFWLKGACPQGDECPKLHLYFRKRNLQQRIDVHGEEKLATILTELAKQTPSDCADDTLMVETPITHPRSFFHASHTSIDFDSSHSYSSALSAQTTPPTTPSPSPSGSHQEAYRFDPYSIESALVQVRW